MQKFLFSTALVPLFLINATAHAATNAELEAQIKALETKLARVEALLDKQQPSGKAVDLGKLTPASGSRYTHQEARQAPVFQPVPVQPTGSDVKVSLKPGPVFETADGNFKFGVNGFLQEDAAWFEDDKVDHPNGTTLRRARLSVKGVVAKDWGYKFETDFANDATKITDAFINYTGLENVTLQAGQFKEPFSLEELTSDRFITFIERASVNTLAPSRNIGVSAATRGDHWTLTAGVFGSGSGVSSTDDESNSVTARATYAPIVEPGKVVHLGIAGSYRQPDSADNALRYRSRMETRIEDLQSVDTGSITGVDNNTLLGLEAATVWDWFSLQGEYIRSDINRMAALPDVSVEGYYVQASAFLTGESRNYNPQEAVFDRITPLNPFSLKEGTWGAWEVATRYSNLDLSDGAVAGGQMDNYTMGINWYPNSNVRFIADYILVNTDNAAVTADDDPQVFTVRAQLDF